MNRSKSMSPHHERVEMAPPKGDLRLDARLGGKELLGKNHEAASISWPGRANRLNLR